MSDASTTGADNRRPSAILFAEDEVLIALDIQWELENAGFVVVGPHTTLSATEKSMQRDVVDGAVLDVDLQGELVFPIADALQERGIPFVLATGNGFHYELNDRYPDAPVVHKPYDPRRLIAHVQQMVGATD